MARIDANRDGILTYTDICDVFRPKNPALSREFGQRMPMELQTSSVISARATKLITKLFTALVKVENHIQSLKKALLKRPNFNVETAFSILNMEGEQQGFDKISVKEIQSILRRHGLITFEKQVGPLFSRFDKDKDGMFGVQDFKSELEPIEFTQSSSAYDLRRFNFMRK